jgi:CRP-like cAMP-binding protein
MMDSRLNLRKKNRPTSEDLQILLSRGWLSERDSEFQERLLENATIRTYAAGEIIYRVGDVADGFYCIVKGSVKISVPADHGQEFEVHREGVGFWIGDLGFFSNMGRIVTLAATAPVRAVFVQGSHMTTMVEQRPEFYKDFYVATNSNVQRTLRICANLAVTGADRRLALRLLQLEETLADADGWISISQDEVAAMVAVSLPTVQRVLKRFSERGAVELGYGRLRIKDRLALTSIGDT